MKVENEYIGWIQKLLAISQTGLFYSKCYQERERYQKIREIAGEMAQKISDYNPESIKLSEDGSWAYCTPQIIVRSLIVCNNKILLVKERRKNKWNIPGGYADIGDTPKDAIKREIMEETGIEVQINYIVGVYNVCKNQLFQQYAIYFLCVLDCCEHINLSFSNEEISQIGFFDLNELHSIELCPSLLSIWDRVEKVLHDFLYNGLYKADFD